MFKKKFHITLYFSFLSRTRFGTSECHFHVGIFPYIKHRFYQLIKIDLKCYLFKIFLHMNYIIRVIFNSFKSIFTFQIDVCFPYQYTIDLYRIRIQDLFELYLITVQLLTVSSVHCPKVIKISCIDECL